MILTEHSIFHLKWRSLAESQNRFVRVFLWLRNASWTAVSGKIKNNFIKPKEDKKPCLKKQLNCNALPISLPRSHPGIACCRNSNKRTFLHSISRFILMFVSLLCSSRFVWNGNSSNFSRFAWHKIGSRTCKRETLFEF